MQYESGFKPAKCHRAAASGHKLGFVSLGFLQVRRTGKHAAAFLPYPGLCFPSLTLQLSRARVLLVPFSAVLAWDGCAELSAVLCSSQPPAHQPGQHWESKVPISLAPGCSQCLCHWCGKSCASGSWAPVLLSWLQAHPSVWALHVQKHFTLQGRVSGVVGVAGREVQGAALFQL